MSKMEISTRFFGGVVGFVLLGRVARMVAFFLGGWFSFFGGFWNVFVGQGWYFFLVVKDKKRVRSEHAYLECCRPWWVQKTW